MLIELMMRLEPSLDFIMLEQYRTCPGILSKNEIGFLQHPYRPEGHIFQISDRCRDYIKDSLHHLPTFRRTAIINL